MNIYKVSQKVDEDTYDVYESAIIVANSLEEALSIVFELDEHWSPIIIEMIGIASSGVEKGVACSSYKYG